MAQFPSLKRSLSAFLVVMLLSACAGRINKEEAAKPPPAPEPGKAVLVVMYPGAGPAVSIFSGGVERDEFNEFIGVISPGSKLAAQVDPGEYRIMIAARGMEFMDADLVGGKTYYALVSPLTVAWNYGSLITEVALKPVPKGFHKGIAFRDWYETTLWKEKAEPSPDAEDANSAAGAETVKGSEAWARKKWKRVFDRQDEYLQNWYEKPARSRLRAKDGV